MRYTPTLILLILLFLISFFESKANNKTDSLSAALTTELRPSIRLKLLDELSQLYASSAANKSEILANQGLQLAQQLQDTITLAKLHRTLGEAAYFKGRYEIAAQQYYFAVQLFEQYNQKHELAITFNTLAKLYRKQRELERAKLFYNRAMDIFQQEKDSVWISTIWNESGVVFEFEKDYEEAFRRFHNSLEISEILNDSVAMGYALNNIAELFTEKGQLNEAMSYLQQCLSIRKQIKDTFALSLAYSDLGALYMSMKKPQDALNAFQTSNSLAEKMNYPELLSANFKQMAEAAKAQNQFEQAWQFLQLSQLIRDSIFSIEKSKQINELNAQYETEKKEQQLIIQQSSISKRNYIIGAILLISFFAGIAIYASYRRHQTMQSAKFQQAIAQEQKLATKSVIKAEENERQRIAQDLHDGVGQMMSAIKLNLSSLQSELYFPDAESNKKLENIFSLVDDSCREVRNVSHNMMPNALLKVGIASAVREFLGKIDTRNLEINVYSDGFSAQLEKDTEILLYRIIQECVNNVVKHAKASRLDISLIQENQSLTITIEDNGKGFDLSNKENFEGIGIRGIISRINYLNGEIEFDSKPGKGTVVSIFIPLA
ncbi:MAG: sensor histidine kinase [Bacteroidetes bacterium]|nr:sensor histidine kinase [Bacteroidota bacterium]